jgi:hypothetical protein
MAERPLEIEVDFTDPYKRTAVFIKDGRAFYGLWNPIEVTLDGDEEEYTIPQGMQGSLDLLADEFYEDRRLWRVIAHANKIDFPHEDVVAGMTIIIPKPEKVRAALLAATGRIREQ